MPTYTYEEQHYNKSMSFKEYDELNKIVNAIQLQKLKKIGTTSCQLGSLAINGKYYYFDNPLGDPERDKLHKAILAFIDRTIPRKFRQIITHNIEGDLMPPREITLDDILKSPDKFDGKRVRVTGYYHEEEYESNFSKMAGDDSRKSIWLTGESTFAKDDAVNWIHDGHVTIDGTFIRGLREDGEPTWEKFSELRE